MNISVRTELIFIGTRPAGGPGSRLCDSIIMCLIAPKTDEIFKKIGMLAGVMSARCQAAIALLRIVVLCNGWL